MAAFCSGSLRGALRSLVMGMCRAKSSMQALIGDARGGPDMAPGTTSAACREHCSDETPLCLSDKSARLAHHL